ncbi:hypothetical protein [Caulobacter sp. 17J80-11]|uniref:hypothetical protein n=1 Tax=Caulobacter sp. 17J80-11 TaxID=2763502 RepID=UPI001653CA26|nr:hypothetical protein [Caulobacter sp. 17J80-11]MBC6981664.1 hypothetical protein [Caulobacter sp. 17J80-11]
MTDTVRAPRRRSASKPAPKPEPDPTTSDPIEIALEMVQDDPAPESPARRLILEQIELIRAERHHLRWQLASERAGLGLKLLTGLAGLVAAGVLAAMAFDAAGSRSLIVEPFSTPADLAGRGLTGQAVASRLVDGLTELQDQTLSSRAADSYDNGWGERARVEIPSTGVSLGELQAYLRGWLGEEVRISGEVTRTPTGVAVIARAGGQPGVRLEGSEAELDALVLKAAEQVYRMTQPERYAAWAHQHGRAAEATAIFDRLAVSGSRTQRARARTALASMQDDHRAALAEFDLARRLDPELPTAWEGLYERQGAVGHDQAALEGARRTAALLNGRRAADLAPWVAHLSRNSAEATVAEELGDYAEAARLLTIAGDPTVDQPVIACRRCAGSALLWAGASHASNRDGAAMRRLRAQGLSTMADASYVEATVLLTDLRLARAVEDWPAVVALARRPAAAPATAAIVGEPQTALTPLLARALAETGQAAEAKALIGATPADCYACQIERGAIAARAGDPKGADAAFARAVAMGPDLPAAHAAWGRALLARGDAEGARRQFKLAMAKGPRFADPLKFDGDALSRLGKPEAALARYAAAAERAPNWGALRLAWGDALERAGRLDQARAQWRMALALDLSAADRAAVKARLS